MIKLFEKFVVSQVEHGVVSPLGNINDLSGCGALSGCFANGRTGAPLFFCMTRFLRPSKIVELLLDFAKHHNIGIIGDRSLLEDIAVPAQLNMHNLSRYATDGIELQSKDGTSMFVTSSIETALEKSLTRKVIFVEPCFYMRFLESLVRRPLVDFVSQKRPLGYFRAFSCFLFLVVNVAFLSLPISVISAVYVSLFCAKTLLILIGDFAQKRNAKQLSASLREPSCSFYNLPLVTVLVPLYKEETVIPQLISSLKSLNYPKELLDVKIVTEASDELTNATLRATNLPYNFHLIAVPSSLPRTKGKAMNYAVRFAIGDYICVYDAEDMPHPQQPSVAINHLRFYQQRRNDDLASFNNPISTFTIQCPLRWYNWKTNLFTLMMSVEYHILFDRFIPTSSIFGGFVPLGGTSNFFLRNFLENSRFWDSHNVTEDFELSLRSSVAHQGAKYCSVPTEEECVASFGPWVRQRSRWIKGFMVSLSQHFLDIHIHLWRKPLVLVGIYIVGWVTILQPLLHPALLFYVFRIHTLPSLLLFIALFVCNVALVWPASGPSGWVGKIVTTITFMLYNALLVIPFCFAVYDIIFGLSHWRKTSHISPKMEDC